MYVLRLVKKVISLQFVFLLALLKPQCATMYTVQTCYGDWSMLLASAWQSVPVQVKPHPLSLSVNEHSPALSHWTWHPLLIESVVVNRGPCLVRHHTGWGDVVAVGTGGVHNPKALLRLLLHHQSSFLKQSTSEYGTHTYYIMYSASECWWWLLTVGVDVSDDSGCWWWLLQWVLMVGVDGGCWRGWWQWVLMVGVDSGHWWWVFTVAVDSGCWWWVRQGGCYVWLTLHSCCNCAAMEPLPRKRKLTGDTFCRPGAHQCSPQEFRPIGYTLEALTLLYFALTMIGCMYYKHFWHCEECEE